jgi:deazaflavin-dependent oxidoreductase (nitroreductase family)
MDPIQLTPRIEAGLKRGFTYLNRLMLLFWRLGLGGFVNIWPEVGGRILVLTHSGRRSGLRRRTPINYAIVGGEIYVTAGFGPGTDWYRNLQRNPAVEVWLPDGWWEGTAEDVSTSPDRLPLLREVLAGSGLVARMLGLDPRDMPAEALDRATASYRLIHIRRTAARTGPGGPGDLAWIWPALVHAWIVWRLLRLKHGGR